VQYNEQNNRKTPNTIHDYFTSVEELPGQYTKIEVSQSEVKGDFKYYFMEFTSVISMLCNISKLIHSVQIIVYF
jgi:hypothetical protein